MSWTYADLAQTMITDGAGRFVPVEPANIAYAALLAAGEAFGPYVAPDLPPALTPLQFIDRLTDTEQTALATAAMTQASIKIWYDKLLAADQLDLRDPRLAAGLQAMAAAGLLAPSRVPELLGAP